MLNSLRRTPLGDLAVSRLRELVLSGGWDVGERLPAETELAANLGVGRSTVREAVRVLVHDGLLETRQGAGTFVRATSEPDPLDLRLRRAELLHVYEVREAIEMQAARLASRHRTATDLRRLDSALKARGQALERAEENDRYVAADVRFHRSVVEATHNPLLLEMFDSFQRALGEGLERIREDADLAAVDNTDAHADLVRAIRARDGDAAAAATARLLSGTTDTIRRLLRRPG